MRFWKTPPESTTVPVPARAAALAQAGRGRRGERVVEPGRHERHRNALAHVPHERAYGRARVEHEWPAVRAVRAGHGSG